jgi:hypothetical protein
VHSNKELELLIDFERLSTAGQQERLWSRMSLTLVSVSRLFSLSRRQEGEGCTSTQDNVICITGGNSLIITHHSVFADLQR